MAGALPPLPPELAHLTPDQQKMIFGRVVGTGEWATPTVAAYNQTVGHLQGYVDERPQTATFYTATFYTATFYTATFYTATFCATS